MKMNRAPAPSESGEKMNGIVVPRLSADDRVVAIEDSLATAALWPGARHVRVDALEHMRLLADPKVVPAAVGFVVTPISSTPIRRLP